MTSTPTARRLNITTGDSAAGTLGEAGIDGKIIAWRDVLHEGPVDSSLSLEALSKQRARFISEQGWDDFAHVSGNFAERDRAIQELDYYDEVVLWFEDDLYDQLQLIQLLDHFAGGAARGKRLALIVVDGYIPPLSVQQLKDLDEKRAPVTEEHFDLGRRAWKAFGSPDPTSISRVMDGRTTALPYLARALTRPLEEFPSTDNGLSRSEREALTAIDAGHNTPVSAFLEVARLQESIFLGDIVFYSYLERLSGRNEALVTWKDGAAVVAPDSSRARDFVDGRLAVTPLGREVLAGRRNWQTITKQARWLGGVEIAPGEYGWRWDRDKRELVQISAATPGKRLLGKTARKSAKRPAKKTAKKTPTKTARKSAKKSRKKK